MCLVPSEGTLLMENNGQVDFTISAALISYFVVTPHLLYLHIKNNYQQGILESTFVKPI